MAESQTTSLHGLEVGLGRPGAGRPGKSAANPNARNFMLRGQAFGVTGTAAAGAANITNVTLQVVDNNDIAVSDVFVFDIWLSDAADGAGLTAVTASGNVQAGASGTDLGDYTAKKAKAVMTDNTGKYILAITDTAKTAFKVCCALPTAMGPRTITMITLAAGNYG